MNEEDILQSRSLLNRYLAQQKITNTAETLEEQQQPTIYAGYSEGFGKLENFSGSKSYSKSITNGAIALGDSVRVRGNKFDLMSRIKQIPQITNGISIRGNLIILFYVEDSRYIAYYTGGNVFPPTKVYTIDKTLSPNYTSQRTGCIHNYRNKVNIALQKNDNATLAYLVNKIRIEIANTAPIYKGALIFRDSELHGVYFFNYGAINYPSIFPSNSTIQKNISSSGVVFAPVTNTYSVAYQSVADETGNSFSRITSYSSVFTIETLIPNGNSSHTGNVDYHYNPISPSKWWYEGQAFDFTSLLIESYSKVSYYWQGAFITESLNKSCTFGGRNIASNPTDYTNQLNRSPLWVVSATHNAFSQTYNLYLNGSDEALELNSTKDICQILASNNLSIDENTTSISFSNTYTNYSQNNFNQGYQNGTLLFAPTTYPWHMEGENIVLYDPSPLIGKNIFFLKKIDNNSAWLCEGILESFIINSKIPSNIPYRYAYGSAFDTGYPDRPDSTLYFGGDLTITINASISKVTKLNYLPTSASDNGRLIINNKSIYSFYFYTSYYGIIVRSQEFVTNIPRVVYPGYGNSTEEIFNLYFSTDIDVSSAFKNTTLSNKTIYVPYYSQSIKTQDITAYVEQWKIEDNGDIVRQDKVFEVKTFKLNSANCNILSASYYP